jgi:hypothetical protein
MASNERIIQGLHNVRTQVTPLECISAIQDSNQRGPHSSSICCRISWVIVATAAADNTAGREHLADTEISGIEVLCRETLMSLFVL